MQFDWLSGSGNINNGYSNTLPVLTIGTDGTSNNPVYGVTNNTAVFSGTIGYSETYNTVSVGTLSLVKVGTGTQVLAGTNGYTGTTTISNGVLRIDGALSNTPVTVVGGTLAGSGIIRGTVTVQSAGTLSPGASIGTLTINNSLTLLGTTSMEFDKLNFTNDRVNAATIAYGGTLVLAALNGSAGQGDSFKLFNAASYTGSFASITPALPAGLNWWLDNNGTLFVNAKPAASNFTMGAASGMPSTVQVIGGKFAPTDPDNDPLLVSAVSSPTAHGATVTNDGVSITYTAPAGYAGDDSFSYTVSDGRGGSDTRTVSVTVVAAGTGFNQVAAQTLGNGDHKLTYAGIPGYSYALESANDLTPPVTWTPLLTNQASSANGQLIFTNTPASLPIYYRTHFVP
jgi:autotransporter-associated beta strand protein